MTAVKLRDDGSVDFAEVQEWLKVGPKRSLFFGGVDRKIMVDTGKNGLEMIRRESQERMTKRTAETYTIKIRMEVSVSTTTCIIIRKIFWFHGTSMQQQ
jgi:hypothetical protein